MSLRGGTKDTRLAASLNLPKAVLPLPTSLLLEVLSTM